MRVNENNGTQYNGITVNTPFEQDKEGVKVDDFLQLMIAQLSNQDFLNPVDDTQYVAQLAQFASMEAMQQMAEYSRTTHALGMVGQTVTAASYSIGGGINTETGVVTKVDLTGDDFKITVNGKDFTLSQIMTVNSPDGSVTQEDLNNAQNLKVIVTKATKDSISVRWQAPVSDPDELSDLKYSVYYTTDSSVDFNNIDKVKEGTCAASEIDANEYDITGLKPGVPYYINVVVTNKRGEEAVYMRTISVTEKGTIEEMQTDED